MKKKSNPWLFPENPKKSQKIQDLFFLIIFWLFLILFGGNHGNPKIAKKKLEKNQKKTNPWLFPENPKKSQKIQDLIFFDDFLIFVWFFLVEIMEIQKSQKKPRKKSKKNKK